MRLNLMSVFCKFSLCEFLLLATEGGICCCYAFTPFTHSLSLFPVCVCVLRESQFMFDVVDLNASQNNLIKLTCNE